MRFTQLQFLFVLTCVLAMNPVRLSAWQSDNGNGTFNNPVLYADYPDPDIIRVTNDFYMVSTTFADSPGRNDLHISGKMLKNNWHESPAVFRMSL